MKLQKEEVMESVSKILNLCDQPATVRQHKRQVMRQNTAHVAVRGQTVLYYTYASCERNQEKWVKGKIQSRMYPKQVKIKNLFRGIMRSECT